MRLLFASDSFKGSLTSLQTADLLTAAAKQVFGEETECVSVPIGDGGEGTGEAVVSAENGTWSETEVHDPLMNRIGVRYGRLDDCRAVLEMASASGLTLVPPEKRNPLRTTSFGTGELILRALDRGFSEIAIAIGGSATNDGGMGCARALGVRFLNRNGMDLEGRGEDLEAVCSIDTSGLDPRVKKTRITVMSDVTNPLCGKNGATYTFGVQKGASSAALARLETGMMNYRDVIFRQFGIDPNGMPGAGAAGGLGTALTVFLGAEMRSGVDMVLDLLHFEQKLEGADLVVTGEGSTDRQSCLGKVIEGVGRRARARGVPAVILSGSLGAGSEKVFDRGIDSMMAAVDAPMTLDEAMGRAEELYARAAVRMFRMIRVGMAMEYRNGR